MSLCISDHELRVSDRRSLRSAPCQLHERLRQVDTDDAFGTGGGRKRRRARPAANVEHDPVRVGPGPFQEGLGEGFELAVVSIGVGDEVRRFGSVPRLRLSFVCSHWLLADIDSVPHHVTDHNLKARIRAAPALPRDLHASPQETCRFAVHIQERFGHSTIRLTFDRYGHLFDGHDQAAAGRSRRGVRSGSRAHAVTTRRTSARSVNQGPEKRPLTRTFLERTTGFEPATLTLAR